VHEGRVTQFDQTIDVYNSPSDLLTAQTFSDPPMNFLPVRKSGSELAFFDGPCRIEVPAAVRASADGTTRSA
jgi:glycerol transport system ATP-binding protein